MPHVTEHTYSSEALHRDGFLVVPDAVSPNLVRHLLDAFSDLPASHAHRNLLEHAAVRDFAASDLARSLILPVLGQTAHPVRAILFDKLPGANWKVPWHQDLSIAVQCREEVPGYGPWSVKEGVPHVQPPVEMLQHMLTLRLHLDDCFVDNGPVRVLPGTHRLGILDIASIQQLRANTKERAAVSPAGGILLMRPLLLHASSPALAPAHRRVLHIEYAAIELPAPLRWHAA
jgi:ectoine hydroxylase-related dioxygenase (phytanoyl-CoA dioxygenase family)